MILRILHLIIAGASTMLLSQVNIYQYNFEMAVYEKVICIIIIYLFCRSWEWVIKNYMKYVKSMTAEYYIITVGF